MILNTNTMPEKPEGQQFEPAPEKQEEAKPEKPLEKPVEQREESQPETEEKGKESSFASLSTKDTIAEKAMEDKKNLCPICGLPLDSGEHDECKKKEEHEVKPEIQLTEEQEKARQEMIECLIAGNIDSAIGIRNTFQVPNEILQSSELQYVARQMMIWCFSTHSFDYALKIKNAFQIPDEIAQTVAKKVMIKDLSHGFVYFPLKIKNTFQIPEEAAQTIAREGMIKCFYNGVVDAVLKIKNAFQIPDEAAQTIARQEMIECLSRGDLNYAIKIKNKFQVAEEVLQSPELQSAARQGMIECLSGLSFRNAHQIKDKFQIPDEVVQSAAKQGMINCLLKNLVDVALRIKDEFQVPMEFLQSPELQTVAKKVMINYLSNGNINYALEVREKISVQITPREIIDQFPDMQELLIKLQEKSPQFHTQAMRSMEVLLSLFNYRETPDKLFETIEENPFLFDAVERNPRFGSMLLVKFESLDNASQENITFLFNAKKEIMEANPAMDPESLEFRQAMQEKLKEFKENPDIVKEIETSGINADQWLDYDQVRYFSLESGKNTVAFSETIATPINRIKETVDSYAHLIKETVKPYHKELSEHQIPVAESGGIDEKIAKMRGEYEKAKREGNEKKSQGILKGMESTEKSKEKTATVSLWNKL